MNQIARIIEQSASPIATNPVHGEISSGVDQSIETLSVLPFPTARLTEPNGWMRARQRLGQISELRLGWNGSKGTAPDLQTVVFAGQELARLQQYGLPAPAINPSPDGAVYAEWHAKGIDVEIIIDAPYKIVVLVEDARGEVAPIERETVDTCVALEALQKLAAR